MFWGWRRRRYSCSWPGFYGFRDYDKTEAKDIIKKRYAKGEITKEEYDNMLNDIN
jgi:hypothetical protein